MTFASGSLLAQSRPAGTSAASIFTASVRTEITRIVVCNSTGSAAAYSIFHDDDGSTFDETTALFYAVSLGANTSEIIDFGAAGGGIMVGKTGQIGFTSGTGNALTISMYGVTQGAG